MPAPRLHFMAAAIACSAVACTDNDNPIPTTEVMNTIAVGHARGDFISTQASQELSGDDFLIVIGKTASILAAFNDGELAQSELAQGVVTSEGVQEFSRQNVVAFTDANTALSAVVRVSGASFLPSTTASQLTAAYNNGLSDLRATPINQIDLAYTTMQVVNLSAAQIMLQELALQVGPGAMNDYIVDTQKLVDSQLGDATMLMNSFFL